MRATYILLTFGCLLRAQDPGAISTVAGAGTEGYSAPTRATEALLNTPYALHVTPFGAIYFTDSWNHRIRIIWPDGTIGTVAGTGNRGRGGDGAGISVDLSYPRGITSDAFGNVYFSDSGNSRIRRIAPNGIVTTFAGSGTAGSNGDGASAVAAQLRAPRGLATDQAGNLYIADSANFRVRRVAINGIISTVAGTGRYGNDGDGQRATVARIGMPFAVAVDETGILYIADPYNHVIRRVDKNGVISTVAGSGTPGFSGDAGDAKSARLRLPKGVAADALGNIYIADTGNQRIRRVDPRGIITTVAGDGLAGFGGNLGPAINARLNSPYGIVADPRGNVIITDLLNQRLRKARLEQLTVPPKISAGGVVSPADYASFPSPGGLMSVFGTGFAYNARAASSLPLPYSLSGTNVLINALPAPIIYSSATQINAQVPWGVTPGTMSVKVNFGGVESEEVRVPVPAAAPAAFVTAARRGIAVNQDGSINAPERPAPRRSVVVIYATGLGAVKPQPPLGAGSPSQPLAVSSTPTVVRFGNIAGVVQFSGLAPGFVGLWQINVTVPPDAPIGPDIVTEIRASNVDSRYFLMSIQGAL